MHHNDAVAATGGLGSTGVPPVPAGVPPGGPRGVTNYSSVNATRRVGGSAGRLCYASFFNAPTESYP
jgi:hypothetical protein